MEIHHPNNLETQMVTKQELLGTITVPAQLPYLAFVAARRQFCGVMYCLRCGSIELVSPQDLGAYFAIIMSNETDKDPSERKDLRAVDYDRLYVTEPHCEKCGQEKLKAHMLGFGEVSLPEESESHEADSPDVSE